MDQFDSANLPPELDELGRRMSDERPVADDRSLGRVMTRAQGARRTRRSFMWRTNAPRTPRKTIALAFAALVATGGMATAASANGLLGGLLGGDIPLISGLLGGDAVVKGNCSSLGGIAVGAGVGSDCSGNSKGANCSAVGTIAVGAGVLSDCSGGSGASANCSAAGAISIGLSVLSDCSRSEPSTDAAETEYAAEANCSAVGTIAVGAGVLSDCSTDGD